MRRDSICRAFCIFQSTFILALIALPVILGSRQGKYEPNFMDGKTEGKGG